MPSPSRPVFFEPSPCRPRSAEYSGLKRKWISVLCCSLDSIQMSPPLPPSPPEGPPRGTNFSRRKAMQPLPPPPALTRILASSINMKRPKKIHPAAAAPEPSAEMKKPRQKAEAHECPVETRLARLLSSQKRRGKPRLYPKIGPISLRQPQARP